MAKKSAWDEAISLAEKVKNRATGVVNPVVRNAGQEFSHLGSNVRGFQQQIQPRIQQIPQQIKQVYNQNPLGQLNRQIPLQTQKTIGEFKTGFTQPTKPQHTLAGGLGTYTGGFTPATGIAVGGTIGLGKLGQRVKPILGAIFSPKKSASVKAPIEIGSQVLSSVSKNVAAPPSGVGSSLKTLSSNFTNRVSIQNYINTVRQDMQGKIPELESFVKNTTGLISESRIKKSESLFGKIQRYTQRGEDPTQIADVLGTRIKVNTPEEALQTINKLNASGKLVETQNFFQKPTNWGYTGINAKIKLNDGSLAEIQVHTPQSLEKADKIHKLYEKWRDVNVNTISKSQLEQLESDRQASLKIAQALSKVVLPKSPEIQKLAQEQLPMQNIQIQSLQSLQKGSSTAQQGLTGSNVPSSPLSTVEKTATSLVGPSKYAFNINKQRLQLSNEQRGTLDTVVAQAKPELEKLKGKTLSNNEVIEAAKTSEILSQVTTREQTLQAEAAMLKARQRMVELDKNIDGLAKTGNTQALNNQMRELVDSLRVVSSNAADKGRQLQSLSIEAGDESIRLKALKDVTKVSQDTEKILKAAAEVDWNNSGSIAKFYRMFVKPSLGDILDEFRYNNMLSSPRTHIRNAFSNMMQTFLVKPTTIFVEGKPVEATKYFTGAVKSLPAAMDDFVNAFKGKTPIGKPDLEKTIPTGKLPGFLTIPSRSMEAADRFFSTLIKGGELARGKTTQQAEKAAEYSLFRGGITPEGQGKVLNAIDGATNWMYKAPKPLRWFVPFIRTPMNFAKQWVEYSPGGIATLPGAGNKREQLAKVMLGSTATAFGGWMALQGKTTWAAPTNPQEKQAFYESGRKPYSIQIGDKWVPMIYSGPFAFSLAMPAAVKWYQEDNRTALTDDGLQKMTKIATSMAQYLSGQTFLEGLGNFVKWATGDTDYNLASNLAFTAGQLIPLQGLVRYVSTIVDPIYRKPGGENIGEKMIQSFKKDIPFASKGLEPYTTSTGEPSKREPQNYVIPYDIGTNKPSDYESLQQLGQFRNLSTKESQAQSKRAQTIFESLKDKSVSREEKLQLVTEVAKDASLKKRIENLIKEDIFDMTPFEKSLSNSDNATRARYIQEQIRNMSPEEKKPFLLNLVKKKILTENVVREMMDYAR